MEKSWRWTTSHFPWAIERPFTVVLELKKRAKAQWLNKEKELVQQIEKTHQKLQISRELKQVRKNLASDIETLGATLKGFNIFLMPLLVSIVGICFAFYRQRRLRRR